MIANKKQTALDYISDDYNLLSETVNHHLSECADGRLPKSHLFEIYSKHNISSLFRCSDTLQIAMSIVQNILAPGLREGKISPAEIHDNLTYTTHNGSSINAAECLLILATKFDEVKYPKENEYIHSLLSAVKTDLNIQPSETFKIKLERSNQDVGKSRTLELKK